MFFEHAQKKTILLQSWPLPPFPGGSGQVDKRWKGPLWSALRIDWATATATLKAAVWIPSLYVVLCSALRSPKVFQKCTRMSSTSKNGTMS